MKSIFTDDVPSTRQPIFEKNAPIKNYSVYVAPHLDETAKKNGETIPFVDKILYLCNKY